MSFVDGHYSLVVKTASSNEPVTLAKAKEHLHIGGVAGADATDEDAYVTSLIHAASLWA